MNDIINKIVSKTDAKDKHKTNQLSNEIQTDENTYTYASVHELAKLTKDTNRWEDCGSRCQHLSVFRDHPHCLCSCLTRYVRDRVARVSGVRVRPRPYKKKSTEWNIKQKKTLRLYKQGGYFLLIPREIQCLS